MMVFFPVVMVVLSLATALPVKNGEDELNQVDKVEEGKEGRVVTVEMVEGELRPLEVSGVGMRRKRYFEEFFQKKTQEERRQRMEELKQRNLSQQRRRAQRREQRRQRKLARRENRKATNRRSSTAGSGRKTRDLPRIDCRVRSPAHVVNLLLLIHSQKVRDVVAGRWLEECNNNKSRPRPSTSLRYFG